jgi:acetylornithine deacetylase/succinyl-diaminopimelate desuccinylase-like protein
MHTDELRTTVAGLMPRLRAELETLVRLPSIAFSGFPEKPLNETAEAVAGWLRAAGLPEVRLVDIEGAPPAVFGARPAKPGAPTALLYAHYDVQPAGDESLWDSPPFQPTERAGRLYGRGAADDKSGIVMHLGAIDALGPGSPVGVKVLIEGAEEVDGTGIEKFVARNGELLAADVIVIADVGN